MRTNDNSSRSPASNFLGARVSAIIFRGLVGRPCVDVSTF